MDDEPLHEFTDSRSYAANPKFAQHDGGLILAARNLPLQFALHWLSCREIVRKNYIIDQPVRLLERQRHAQFRGATALLVRP